MSFIATSEGTRFVGPEHWDVLVDPDVCVS
jgi:hypothetical protein